MSDQDRISSYNINSISSIDENIVQYQLGDN